MKRIQVVIERLGGLARRAEILEHGIDRGSFDVAAWYQRHIIRVRRGWYALPGEDEAALRAWRLGGRLTCISALAFYAGAPQGPALHVEVPAGSSRLRDPDDTRRRLTGDAPVVLHWTRHPGPGDRRAVSVEHALAVAAGCGTRGAGAQAAATSSASRIVYE